MNVQKLEEERDALRADVARLELQVEDLRRSLERIWRLTCAALEFPPESDDEDD